MKRTVKLHPVTVMLGLLAGGTLAGFWGVLLAVPAIAVTKIILGHLWTTRVLGLEPELSNEDAVPDSDDAEEVLQENKEREEQLEKET